MPWEILLNMSKAGNPRILPDIKLRDYHLEAIGPLELVGAMMSLIPLLEANSTISDAQLRPTTQCEPVSSDRVIGAAVVSPKCWFGNSVLQIQNVQLVSDLLFSSGS